MEEIQSCPVCKNNTFEPFLICKDYTVSKENFYIVSCKSCGLKLTNPRPSEEEIGRYYQSEEYISHSNTQRRIIDKVYHLVRKITIRGKLNLINSLQSNKGSILDIGCGTGMFLNICKENGWQIAGIEPDTGARQLAIENTKETIEGKILGSFDKKTFSVITMWHVLEHIHRLEDTLTWIEEKLNADGTLIVAVPNFASKDAHIYNSVWAAYDVPRHLYHFSQNTMEALMKQHGLKIIKTLPMKFDSYYVSMLSTKYRDGTINYVEALKSGITSNLKANTSGEYSSLIYIIKKK